MNTSDDSLVTGGINALRMWTLDIANRKVYLPSKTGRKSHISSLRLIPAPSGVLAWQVRPIQVTTNKEVRTYTCIAISPDDTTLYCGTETGDVMVVSAEKQTLITQGPPKGACLGCGVQVQLPSRFPC